jgi:hypothetical protein
MQVFARPMLPMTTQQERMWVWKAIEEPVCYNSIMFVAKSLRLTLSGDTQAQDNECTYHQGLAIRQINERLVKHSAATDSGLTLAIICLAVYEVGSVSLHVSQSVLIYEQNLIGSQNTAAVHIAGLEVIQRLRKGQSNDDMSAFLQYLIQWYDSCWEDWRVANIIHRTELSNASAARRRSRLVPQDLLSRDTYELASAGSMIFNSEWVRQWGDMAPRIEYNSYRGMTSAAAAIFHRIRQLSHIRAHVKRVQDLELETLYRFTRNVSILERHINTIVNWPSPEDDPQPARCMPLYSSALIFIYAIFRDLPASSPILSPFTMRLRNALETLGLESFCEQVSEDFLLWMLFLGSWVTAGRDEHDWYISALRWLTKRLRISSWTQVKLRLSRYCFVESVYGEAYRNMWDESKTQ